MLYSTHVPELIFSLTDYLSTKFVSTNPSIALLCPMWDDTTMAWTESSKPIETSPCCDLLSLTFWCWYAVDEIHKFNPKFQTSGFVSLIQESPYLKPNLLYLCQKRWEGLRERHFLSAINIIRVLRWENQCIQNRTSLHSKLEVQPGKISPSKFMCLLLFTCRSLHNEAEWAH